MIEFGTGVFRSIIGEGFTKENVQKIAQAISNIIIEQRLKKKIVLGYDQRFLSKESSIWISEVFAGNNISVLLTNKVVPTPSIETLEKYNPSFQKQIAKIESGDGFKYTFTDGTWLLIRFSKNEPVLRIHTEQKTLKEASDLMLYAKKYIENIDG